MSYVDFRESAEYNYGSDTGRILEVIAQRYMGENTKLPYTYGTYSTAGILYHKNGRYDASDMDQYVRDVKEGDYVLIAGLYYSDSDYQMNMYIDYRSPGSIYINGELWDKANWNDELLDNGRFRVMDINKGYNSIIIKVQKSQLGFGIIFGAEGPNYHFFNVKSPFKDRYDRNGFAYSNAFSKNIDENNLPNLLGTEAETGYQWLPKATWDKEALSLTPFERLFGAGEGYLYAWTKADCDTTINIESAGNVYVVNNGAKCYTGSGAATVSVKRGNVLIVTDNEKTKISGADLVKPVNVRGIEDAFLYLGRTKEAYTDICDINQVVAPTKEKCELADHLFWQVDLPSTWVRTYIEDQRLYGAWSYPLGVTLYGILKAGRLLNKTGMTEYVLDHIASVVNTYRYAKWDKLKYGYAALHQKLVLMEMLDDCGSMGSTALEAGITGEFAEDTANFIEHDLERRPDGAFYRICAGRYSNNTMWADDLYMSTPFLMRYFKLTGERKYIDEAAKQFLLFKKYLFIEEEGIMSHVYNFNFEKKTNIPWGRGNGWVIFSLSELLEFLPSDHELKPELLEFFRVLCKNYLRLQGENGMWHQVINLPESYLETSCTAMFTYAFARGVRFGWLLEQESYIEAVNKGWLALKTNSIDKEGNVHGVCHGSMYSFSTDYYKYDLLWRTNDTHGIGIVMLAGAERENMVNSL